MNKVYQAARAAYRAGEFTSFEVRVDDIATDAIVYHAGKFISVYVSTEAARKDIAAQCEKASKFIGL